MKYWNSPETTSINREPMLNLVHEDSVSLDGNWDFQLLRSPDDHPSRSWTTIPVPGLWTAQEESHHFWDRPIYTNVQMPFDELPPFVPALNPTGIFERDFTVLDNWMGERIVLQIGGFESVAILSINGVEVGMAKDSRLAADFEISSFVNPGKNRVQIKVVKWSDATYIEDQDQWWHGGITRSIKLFVTPVVHVARFYPTVGLKADGKTGTLDIRAFVAAAQDASFIGYSLSARVEGVGRSKALSKTLQGASRTEWTEMPAEIQAMSKDFFHGTYWDGKVPAAVMDIVEQIEPPTPWDGAP
jgi:beta-galactosidase